MQDHQDPPPSRHRPPAWVAAERLAMATATDRLLLAPDGDGRWEVRRRHDGAVLGAVTLDDFDGPTASARLHVHIEVSQRRRGVAAEAVRAVLSIALRPVDDGGVGLRRVGMTAAGSDTPARGLARSLAIRREVRRRQDRWVDGVGVDDTYGWGVLREEWDADAGRMRRDATPEDVGVGPHPEPWPDDPHLDHLLLRDGDRRNVADRYRYWRHEAIVADLAASAHPFHVAIENWVRDANIGTIVRNANAFAAAGVHVVGRRGWNRRGAMVTDRYLTIHHHDDVASLAAFARGADLDLIGIDNLPGSRSLFDHPPPRRAVLLFGQEGPGLSDAARVAVRQVLHIPQYGSTRSINAGVASGVAMAEWARIHAADG